MNPTLIAFGIASIMALGLVVTVAAVSLITGGLDFLVAGPKVSILKSKLGKSGLAFAIKWNSAKEPIKFDMVRVRLLNPFGSPTQVDIDKQFSARSETFAEDLDLGPGMEKLLSADGINQAKIIVQVSSTKDGIDFQKEMRASDFFEKRENSNVTADDFNEKHNIVNAKPLFHTVSKSFIAETAPNTGRVLKIASNPEFAAELAGASAGGAAAAVENFSIAKVWIEDGCIVCDACEGIYPEVFKVTDTTCIIHDNYPQDNGILIEEAAEACPVEVIKYTKA